MNKRLLRILIGGVIFAASLVMFEAVKLDIFWLELSLYILAFVITGGDTVYKAVRNILRGKVFDENLLMTIATIGAFAIKEFPEAVAVMLFYQVGEFFQGCAVRKSRKSIASLMDIRPDYAVVMRDGVETRVSPEEVNEGDIIVVSAGEKIPLDGRVISGDSMLDTSALTGESVPKRAEAGSDVISGCINLSGVLTIEVTKNFEQSTVSKILDLVENAASKKSNPEKFISKFARYYTPAVVIVAALLAAVPPLAFGADFSKWLYIALSFLVASCPCALVISIPMSFFGGLGGASRSGILIKGSNFLESLAKTDTIVFDKTGTLTQGAFSVQKIRAVGMTEDRLLYLTAHAEGYSNHPVAFSLRQAYGQDVDKLRIGEANEVSGHGVIAVVDGSMVAAGNAKLMQQGGVQYLPSEDIGTVVHVAVDGIYAGYILIADSIKPDSYAAIAQLKKVGIKQTVMLTGDLDAVGRAVAEQLGIDRVFTELLPDGKVEKLEELFEGRSGKGCIAFVGDGINDAPVLARADIGIAMGGLGSDAAIEAADVVIMNDQPSKIAEAKRIAKKTLGIATQNILFAIAVKVAILSLIVFGLVNMWMAIVADVGVTVVAVLNAFRALSIKKKQAMDTGANPAVG